MEFPRFKYMTWAKEVECASGIHLSSSGLPCPAPEALDLLISPPRIKQDSTYGDIELIEAIAKRYRSDSENIFLAPGSSAANYTVMGVLLEKDDEVIVESPAYEVLAQIPLVFGAKVKRWHRKFENSWKLDFKQLSELLTNKTKLIVLTNPHNPTGISLDSEELTHLKQIADAHDLYVMFDEVFIEMIKDKFSISALNRSKRFVVTGSITKAFGLGGIRLGWAIAQPHLVEKMMYFQDLMSVNNAEPSMDIALRLFKKIDEFVKHNAQILIENSAIIENWLEKYENIQCKFNTEVAFCFPRLTEINTQKFLDILQKKYNTYVVPGHFFDNYVEHIRLGFGINKNLLLKGLENIDLVLNSI